MPKPKTPAKKSQKRRRVRVRADAAALTPKQARFVELYAQPGASAKQAYRDAFGSSAAVAETNGPRLLTVPTVAAAIAKSKAVVSQRAGVTAARALQEMADLAFYDPADAFHLDGTPKAIHEIPEATRRALASYDVQVTTSGRRGGKTLRSVVVARIRLRSKDGPLNMIGKHLDMFTERHEFSGPQGGPIQVQGLGALEKIAGRLAGMASRVTPPPATSNGNGKAHTNGNGNGRHG